MSLAVSLHDERLEQFQLSVAITLSSPVSLVLGEEEYPEVDSLWAIHLFPQLCPGSNVFTESLHICAISLTCQGLGGLSGVLTHTSLLSFVRAIVPWLLFSALRL